MDCFPPKSVHGSTNKNATVQPNLPIIGQTSLLIIQGNQTGFFLRSSSSQSFARRLLLAWDGSAPVKEPCKIHPHTFELCAISFPSRAFNSSLICGKGIQGKFHQGNLLSLLMHAQQNTEGWETNRRGKKRKAKLTHSVRCPLGPICPPSSF
mmetsp:Transcript_29225/g.57334  ORF Transcript_29225/g.57334 Transcript_29225/m.57334 type:complete len:152 (+) Transcript_29225:194-649(+)